MLYILCRFTGVAYKLISHTFTCCCNNCMEENYVNCENSGYVREFKYYKLNILRTRVPKTHYIKPTSRTVRERSDEFQVEKIVDSLTCTLFLHLLLSSSFLVLFSLPQASLLLSFSPTLSSSNYFYLFFLFSISTSASILEHNMNLIKNTWKLHK